MLLAGSLPDLDADGSRYSTRPARLVVVPIVSKTMSEANSFTPPPPPPQRTTNIAQPAVKNTGPFQGRQQASYPSTAKVSQRLNKCLLPKYAGQTVVLPCVFGTGESRIL